MFLIGEISVLEFYVMHCRISSIPKFSRLETTYSCDDNERAKGDDEVNIMTEDFFQFFFPREALVDEHQGDLARNWMVICRFDVLFRLD